MDNMATKVTSLGSTSGAPTPPNTTPRTDAETSSNNGHETAGQPNFDIVGAILGPIQEDLNEQAEIAMLPSPPINTAVGSPAPSVYKATTGRSRGFSILGDRLSQLKLQERTSPKDSDAASSSHSVPGDDDGEQVNDAASVGQQSMPKKSTQVDYASLLNPLSVGNVHTAATNARIQEFIQLYRSSALSTPSSSTAAVAGTNSTHSRDVSLGVASIGGELHGVLEKSIWAAEVEDAAERVFLQLEQLAADEHGMNPSIRAEEYFVNRLEHLLKNSSARLHLRFTKGAPKDITSSATPTLNVEASTQAPDATTGGDGKDVVKD